VLLPRLAKAVIEEMAHLTQKHRFLVDFPAEFPIVDADPRRITQVLRNLLDNAVKYSPSGGLVVVSGEVREPEVVLGVADQGEGIAPEHLNRLFEKYFRIKSGLGRHVVGTGLGLPIARTIVDSHGGRIWAESQLGQGTTFYFTIPRSKSEPERNGPQGADL
jgi:signal transduction histidine kinase